MADSKLDVILRLQGGRKFQRDAGKSAESVDKIGRSGRRAGKGLGATNKASGIAAKGLKRAAGAALGLAAGYASISAAKDAITTTVGLAKTTIGLSKNLKLSTERASEWAAVANVRGVDAKALNMSFGTLSKQAVAAGKGTEASADAFKQLGISQAEVKELGFDELLGRTADGLKKMGSGKDRTALTMKLFGRGWQTVVPLLREGSAGMNEQLGLAKKYGATFGGKTIKDMGDFIAAQREADLAMLGLKVTFATAVVPSLTKGIGAVSKFILQMRRGKGPGGEFAKTAKDIWTEAKPIVLWFGRAAVGIAKFSSKHPALVKTATAIGLIALAIKRVPGGSFIAKHIATGLGAALKRRLSSAGTAGGVAAGDAIATSTARETKRKMGRFGGMRGTFTGAGRTLGKAFGVAAVVAIGFELDDWIQSRTGNISQSPGDGIPPSVRTPGAKGGTTLDFAKELFGFQHGGALRPGRSALVGEAGPEILTARPGGGFVTPLKQMTMPDLRSITRDGDRTTVVPVSIDGKEVARVVAKHTADSKARR